MDKEIKKIMAINKLLGYRNYGCIIIRHDKINCQDIECEKCKYWIEKD